MRQPRHLTLLAAVAALVAVLGVGGCPVEGIISTGATAAPGSSSASPGATSSSGSTGSSSTERSSSSSSKGGSSSGTSRPQSSTSSSGATSTGASGYVLGGCTTLTGCDGTVVSVVAGNGSYGFQDGKQAEFGNPQGVAVDSQGDVVVADTANNAIREIEASGGTTTLAGNGDAGYLDGPAASALFNNPTGVAVDPTGTVYVADQVNQRIRTISAGTVATLAGNGRAGSVNGAGTGDGGAEFDYPSAVALDSQGNCYVADTGNRAIRVISPAGNVSTLAKIPGGSGPAGVAVDGSGNVYATDGSQIFQIQLDGQVAVLAGTTQQGLQNGLALTSLWGEPLYGIAVDASGDVYVADHGNALIRRIDPSGYVLTVAGGGDGGIAGAGGQGGSSSVDAVGLAVDGAGNLYAADEAANQIAKLQLGCVPSAIPQVCCGCGCAVLATVQARPSSIAVDKQNVYWSDFGSTANDFLDGAVYQMPKGGGPILALATGQASTGPLAVDDSNVYWTTFYSDCAPASDGGACPDNSGTVNQVPIGGGVVKQLATKQPLPYNIAVDATNVYWSNEGSAGAGAGDAGPSLWTIPIGGSGPAKQLVEKLLETSVGQGGGLAVDDHAVYWEGLDDGGASSVDAMPKGGGPITTLVDGQTSTVGLTIDADNAYWWSPQASGTVSSAPLDGGAAPTVVVSGTAGFPTAQDSAHLYLVDFSGGNLLAVPKAGAPSPTTVCGGQSGPQWAATDGTSLYWVAYGAPGDQGGMVVAMSLADAGL